MIGERVRLTIHAPDGTPITVEGTVEALAAQPDPALNPREPRPWPCLVKIVLPDDLSVAQVITYNAVDLEVLEDAALDVSAESDEITLLRGDNAKLDDECAQLTADLKNANALVEHRDAQLLQATRERDAALAEVARLSAETSKVAAATKPGKRQT